MYCNFCGSYIPDDSQFCPSCGRPTPQPEAQETLEYKDGGLSPTRKLLIAAFVLLVLNIVVGGLIMRKRSQDTSEQPHDTLVVVRHLPTLHVSPTNISVGGESCTRNITVTTNGHYQLEGINNSWFTAMPSADRVVLRIRENDSGDSRNGAFIIRVGQRSEIVTVSQARTLHPDIYINNTIHVNHNTYNNGIKGMWIRVDYTATDMAGRDVALKVYFYQEDNCTPLYDRQGNGLTRCGSYTTISSNHTSQTASVFMPYSELNVARGSYTLTFDVEMVDGSDNALNRNNNYRFNFTLY